MNKNKNTKSEACAALEAIRKKLLDLSTRNRLLNFTHRRTNSVRVVDELPDQLYQNLLAGKEFTFLPVPEPTKELLLKHGFLFRDEKTGRFIEQKQNPTAREWAGYLGIKASFHLPEASEANAGEDRYNDMKIQVLLYPHELETSLMKLTSKARTAIEETGTNILFVAFGFLEWFDRGEEEKSRMAPLVLLPVKLEKGKLNSKTRMYQYTLNYTSEDIVPNLSLREKARVDFGFAIPDFNEGTKIEDYFTELGSKLRRSKPGWKIHRMTTLAMFNFGKLLMYLDLDPKNWPKSKGILENSVINKFLGGALEKEESDHISYEDEYKIDTIEEIHEKYPLIDDADSSQHSALIDVINGNNLVIEGPPGTGKSQTITNIIAAALHQGKKVLFVAEKLAALEVVKRRLDNANLGTFCLELHSHKTQKRKVLDDIEKRMRIKYNREDPEQIERKIERYEKSKSELDRYGRFIAQSWKNTGKSVYDIIMLAVRAQRETEIKPKDIYFGGISGDNFNYQQQVKLQGAIRSYQSSFVDVSLEVGGSKNIKNHPWYGVNDQSLQVFDTDAVCLLLRDWQSSLEKLATLKTHCANFLSIRDKEHFDSFDKIKILIKDLSNITGYELNDHGILALVKDLQDDTNHNNFSEFINIFVEIQNIYRSLSKSLNPRVLLGTLNIEGFTAKTKKIEKITQAYTLENSLKILNRLEKAYSKTQENIKIIQEVSDEIGGKKLVDFFEPTIIGIRRFTDLLKLFEPYDESIFRHRNSALDDQEVDLFLDNISFEISNLNKKRCFLAEKFYLEKLTNLDRGKEILQIIQKAGFFRCFSKKWRIARKEIFEYCKSKTTIRKIKSHFSSLINLCDKINCLNENNDYMRVFSQSFKGINTPTQDLRDLRKFYVKVREQYGKTFGWHTFVGDFIFGMSLDQIKGLKSLIKQGFVEELLQIESNLQECNCIFKKGEGFLEEHQFLIGDSPKINSLIILLREFLEEAINLFNDREISILKACEITKVITELNYRVNQWKKIKLPNRINNFVKSLSLEFGALNDEEKIMQAKKIFSFSQAIRDFKTDNLANYVYKASSFDDLNLLRNDLSLAYTTSKGLFKEFQQKTTIDPSEWGVKGIQNTIIKNSKALDNPDSLDKWITFNLYRNNIIKFGFGKLAKAVELGSIEAGKIENAYEAGVYGFMALEIFTENPEYLQLYSGRAIEELRANFCKYDEELKGLYQRRIFRKLSKIFVPQGSRGARVSSYTENFLLAKECAKQRKHIPIRQLVNRASKALQALKPCFMMGPMSVAQYLEAGKLKFDLLIMDEASQIKPEDALGAIARAEQVVIVGDPKQLPPTSFFNKIFGGEDEDTVIEESESILDAAFSTFDTKPRRLRWHYRSQHESLIAFSNKFFYDSNLIVFPSPYSKAEGYGIQFSRIAKGCFVNRRNIEEARLVAQAIKDHLIHNPSESLGVAAMNIEQKDEIEVQVELLSKTDFVLQKALASNQERIEPLFIKNLENVQGDERDVIFISLTYGPEFQGARVMQRFGPINSSVGWRRLNVLFTRAKKRMHIFSSMGQEDIVVDETSHKGVTALKEFLIYASTGELIGVPTIKKKEPANDFERAVVDALVRAGFECVPQVGVAGFFIDIAVKDPGRPGNFLMGVECDGATYHSSKSVRDRDRLRQEVLERLGWRIKRVWSTDWFKNSEAELSPIIKKLQELKTKLQDKKDYLDVDKINRAIVEKDNKSNILQKNVKKGLGEALRNFDKNVIRKKFKNTSEEERFLSEDMIDELVMMQPQTTSEFQQKIPSYLRLSISPDEGEFLEQILQIIRHNSTVEGKKDLEQLEVIKSSLKSKQLSFEDVSRNYTNDLSQDTCLQCAKISSVLRAKDYLRTGQEICICCKSSPNYPIKGKILGVTDKGIQIAGLGSPYYSYKLLHNVWCDKWG